MKSWLSFLFIAPMSIFAQTVITGKVVDADNKPVADASVFLSNATVGTKTNNEGDFRLINVKPGQYDLVVSIVGYETHHQNINAGSTDINLAPILLMVKNNQLKEVRIGPPDPKRNGYLQLFTREFLGESENAADCKILNPQILDLDYNSAARTLTASSDDFLIIENKALGYRIHYQLTHFLLKWDRMSVGTYSTYYDGNVLFENLTGSVSQLKKWNKKRLETYLGSSMHFLRAIIANRLDTDGFKVLRLVRKPNPDRPNDSLIRAKIVQFGRAVVSGSNTIKYNPDAVSGDQISDSLKYWREKFNMPKIFEFLVSKPLLPADFVKRIDAKSIYALSFSDYLYIAYPKKNGQDAVNLTIHLRSQDNYNTTIITINTKFALFDQNGIFTDPTSTVFEGAWGKSGNADLLPVDYVPLVK
jgi:hypothetical protein